ncbi:tRNA 2-thiouridine(34) synthase MnmA [Persephonella sp. IF05-L8]|uniref:tRNA 2-thiouridine(34) synthase MnmA n=1 Tax=Persephonella sp. IF05-L8 TaxID=1158338 RepID=UPI0004953CD1
MKEKRRAIALYSGGLDSTLAIKLIQNQGIDVIAVHFYTGFCITETKRRRGEKKPDGSHYMNPALKYAAKYGFKLEIVDISEEYFDIVTNPKYGYGANINPCIDCRAFMYKKAKELMDEFNADFIISGEVLNQRPMSQHLKAMKIIEREAGVEGLVLKPLSAKVLPPTIPEIKGWVDREKLEGIVGRSRKRQLQLAKELGIDEFEQPAGGCCYLTDENFARKYMETLSVENKISREDLYLLTIGRHFRLPTGTKVVVSRNEGEGNFIRGLKKNYWFFEPVGKGAVAIAKTIENRELTPEEIKDIANLVARYSKTDENGKINIKYTSPTGVEGVVKGQRLQEEIIESWRI